MRVEASVPRLRSSPRGQPRPAPIYPKLAVTKHRTGLTTSRPSVTGGGEVTPVPTGPTVELTTLTVDRALQGVVVPAGEGDISMSYSPRFFWLGAAISLVCLVVTIRLLWR